MRKTDGWAPNICLRVNKSGSLEDPFGVVCIVWYGMNWYGMVSYGMVWHLCMSPQSEIKVGTTAG